MNINEEQILAELERILISPRFRARKLIRTFLRYTVHETLAGRGDELNQYAIAVHALGKPQDFSPTYNPTVRIEAGRLRKLLHEHYAEADQQRSVMITMPKGTYQVAFGPCPKALPVSTPVTNSMAPHVTEGPRLGISCHVLDTAPINYPVCHKLRSDLLLMLNRFRNICLVTPQSQANHPQHHTDYSLHCDIQPLSSGFELFYTFTHTLSGELVWTNTQQLPAQPSTNDLNALCLQLAANTVAVHSGKVLYHWARYQQSMKSVIPAHQQTLVCYLAFLRDITRDSFSQALTSCQQRLEHFPNDSKALVIFARLCGYDHVLQYHLIDNLASAWTQAARKAMKLDPDNAEAHSVFAHNRYFLGDYALCRVELEVARQLNPFDTSIEYLYGFSLYLMGNQEAGMQAINTLMRIPFTRPDWYHVLPFLHAFNESKYQEALALAEHIQHFGYWGELARCVSYFQLGETERSLSELKELLQCNSNLLPKQNPDNRSIFSHDALKKVLKTLQEIKTHTSP